MRKQGPIRDTRAEPENDTPLMSAAGFDHPSVIRTLLSLGADIDAVQKSGRTAVEAAAYTGNLDATRTLIEEGAHLDTMDNDGYTALRCSLEGTASGSGLGLAANPHSSHHLLWPLIGTTALHLAVRHGYLDVAERLMRNGADLHACDIDGDPPLQWAVQIGHAKMIRRLLDHGADVNKRNEKTGKTVLRWAVKCGHAAVTELLLGCGADASLLDLSVLKKLEETGEEDFEACQSIGRNL